MALIANFEPVVSEKNSLHRPVSCGFRSFDHAGNKILQLDTYGTVDRQMPNKISQSIQIDRKGAEALICLIRETFGDI
ncbi:hypothetical protein BST13_06390 [Mycobacterium aquaticum]|uniref:Methionyl-tRNA formyltransferase n=1 Tax=Mycobacterium aquaticum TaxID=1927124 RepID=A0A1X0B7B3_9MYCO|nr:hypothetical protein BST13_06390 [Mycobacterium aquaticum]